MPKHETIKLDFKIAGDNWEAWADLPVAFHHECRWPVGMPISGHWSFPNQIAIFLAKQHRRQVRWNFTGQPQGHYVLPE